MIAGSAVFSACEMGWLQAPEFATYDRFVRFRSGEQDTESPVVLVQITEADIQRFMYPITDAVMSDLLSEIMRMDPAAVGIDIFRDLASEGRERFLRLVGNHPHIFLIEKRLGVPINAPSEIDRAQVGFADLVADSSGIIRRGLLLMWGDSNETASLSFSTRLALYYLAQRGVSMVRDAEHPEQVRLGNTTLRRLAADDIGYVNADYGGYQYLLDYGRRSFQTYSMSQVLDRELDRKAIADRVVIIGMAAPGVRDLHETPLSTGSLSNGPMFGMEIQAHATDQLLRTALNGQQPLRSLNRQFEFGLILLMAVLGGLIGSRSGPPLTLFLVAAGAIIVTYASALALFLKAIWIPADPMSLALAGAFAVSLSSFYQKNQHEFKTLNNFFGRYVDKRVAQELWKQREQFMEEGKLRPQRLTATVMITDFGKFVSATENMQPADIQRWLNSYLGMMTRVIAEHNGLIEDFAGDGLKVNFGVPVASDARGIVDDAKLAVRCALAMGREMGDINRDWVQKGYPSERLRIGICTGEVVAASFGGDQRLAFKTVGNTVNTAARLESFEKDFFNAETDCDYRVLISQSTRDLIDSEFVLSCLGTCRLKGQAKEITIYRVSDETRNQYLARTY